jgi:hypothetical protein
METLKESVEKPIKKEKKENKLVCTMCGKLATQLVDGEPSCAVHVEQVYEHQLEDYTCKHLSDNEWHKA